MGSSASCRNSRVQSTFQKESIGKHETTQSLRRSCVKGSSRLDHTKSVIKKRPVPSDQPNLAEELNCSWCDTSKEDEEKEVKGKKDSVVKSSKQCSFPYQDASRSEMISDLPKTPAHYEAVNNWKTSLPEEKNNEINLPCSSNEVEGTNVKNSSEVQINSSTDSVRTFVLVQDDEQKQGSYFIPPLISVQLDPGESQSSSSDPNSNCECENDDNSSTKDSTTSRTESEGHGSITENLRTNISFESLHEMQESHGCDNDNVSDENFLDPNEPAPVDGEHHHEQDSDGIMNILDYLQECNLNEKVMTAGERSDLCLCGHVCSDDRYRDTLMEMIREETPDRADIVTSIFCDEYYHEDKMGNTKLRSFDEDDVSLEVNIRSPSLSGNFCRLCLTEDINEEDEDEGSPRQYRVIEELELNKYELCEYEDDDGDEKDVKSNCSSDEEENFNSDNSTMAIIEENPVSALSESTDQEIDFLRKNVSFDRDELSTILLRDKRQKFADLRTQTSENNGSKDRKNKMKSRKSRARYSRETCPKKRKMRRRRSVCGKLECSFCDLVNLTGREGDNDEAGSEWNQLDSDTVKLMDILDKLSRVLAEKAKGLVNRRNENLRHRIEDENDDDREDRVTQTRKKDQLHELRQLGVSVKKVENRRRLLILKDDASQYRIQGLCFRLVPFNINASLNTQKYIFIDHFKKDIRTELPFHLQTMLFHSRI